MTQQVPTSTDVLSYNYSATFAPSEAAPRAARYIATQSDLRHEYFVLRNKWLSETFYSSSISAIVRNPSFKMIVALGEKVVPIIIDDVRVSPSHLVIALQLITGQDPISNEERGDLTKMASAWISWHEQRK